MRKILILSVIIATFALVASAHAQCMSSGDDMKVVCIKSEGMGEGCCKMMGQKGMCHHGEEGCAGNFYLCCAKELEFNDAQVKRLKTIQFEYQKATIRMQADLEIQKLELKNLLHQPSPDRSAIDNKISEMGKLKTEMKKSHVHSRLDARSVLTKEQLEKSGQCAFGCCRMGMKKISEQGPCSKEGTEGKGYCK